MSPQRMVRPEKRQEARLVSLAPRVAASRQSNTETAAWGEVAKEAVRSTSRDWIAWACLGLGVLCGVGAVHFAVQALLRQ